MRPAASSPATISSSRSTGREQGDPPLPLLDRDMSGFAMVLVLIMLPAQVAILDVANSSERTSRALHV